VNCCVQFAVAFLNKDKTFFQTNSVAKSETPQPVEKIIAILQAEGCWDILGEVDD